MTRYIAPITPANTAARVEMKDLPDMPGVVAYQITADTPDDVQHEINRIMENVTLRGGIAEFRNPFRFLHAWMTRGYVMPEGKPFNTD
jgi:hypothetical protein